MSDQTKQMQKFVEQFEISALIKSAQSIPDDPERMAFSISAAIHHHHRQIGAPSEGKARTAAYIGAMCETIASLVAQDILRECGMLKSFRQDLVEPYQTKSITSFLHDSVVVALLEFGSTLQIVDIAKEIVEAAWPWIVDIFAECLPEDRLPDDLNDNIPIETVESHLRYRVRKVLKRLKDAYENRRRRQEDDNSNPKQDTDEGTGTDTDRRRKTVAILREILIGLGVQIGQDFLSDNLNNPPRVDDSAG